MTFVFRKRTSVRHLFLPVAATMGLPALAHATPIAFDSSTFTLNHSTMEDQDKGDVPTISNGVLTITNGGPSDANTAYYNTPVSVSSPFTASFTFQSTNPTGGAGSPTDVYGADGATFTLVSTSTGTGYIGGRGSGLGWGNNDSGGQRSNNYIPNSAAVEFTTYPASGAGSSYQTGIVTAGPTGGTAGNYQPSGTTTGLNYANPINAVVSYDGTNLSEVLTDTVTGATFSYSQPVDLAGIVGSSAYLGFTGGSGGDSSTQQFSNLDFTPAAVPEPASLGLLGAASIALLGRRRRRHA